jgi:hypothetical protein
LPACACAYVQACIGVRARVCMAWNGKSRLALALDFRLVALVGAAGHLCPQTAMATPRAVAVRDVPRCYQRWANTQHPTLMRALGRCCGRVQRQPGDPTRATRACVRVLLRCGHACRSIVSVQACVCARGRGMSSRADRHEWHCTNAPRRSRSSRTQSWIRWLIFPRGTEPFRTFDGPSGWAIRPFVAGSTDPSRC